MKEMWSEIEACFAKYKDESSEENVEIVLDENEKNEVHVITNNVAEVEEQVQEGENNIQIEEGDVNVPDDGHNLIDDESDTNVSRSINESGIDKNILEMAQGIEDELMLILIRVMRVLWLQLKILIGMITCVIIMFMMVTTWEPSEPSVENTDEGGIETSESSSDKQQQYHPPGRPRRNVRSNIDWRDQTGEFGDEGHQRLRGQKNFQRKIGNLFFQRSIIIKVLKQ